ncbi:MAG TPA: galactose oxidase-like domain-containing protein [Gemmatimonadales bacterium]|nr:galactose oxidase-like domain-containing protein [Gemmatimonadales bacterium]
MNRGRSILAFALIATLASCVERRTSPSLEPGAPDVQPSAALTSATIAQTLLASGHDPNNLKVYTTASIAPAPNALVTVAVLTHQSSSAAPAPTLTGGGMAAWDLVATTTFNGATPLDRVTIFRAMSAAPGSGPITITSSVTVSNCQWIVSQWDGVETGGANGAGAIVQTGATSGAAVNGLTVTLAAFADAADVGYGVFGIASATAAATAGTGFTRIDEQPSGEGTTGDLFAEWAASDNTIDASWASKSAGALGVEIKAAGSSGGGGGGVSAALSTVSASPGSITAGGGTSTITVTAKDANGNAISGATVVLAATGTGNTLTQPAATTDANGVATGSLASTVAGAKTVSAKINGTSITQTATVTVTPGPVDASQSTVTAAPASVVTGAPSTITVTAKDANGNPISGATVVLAATGMRTLTQPTDTTSASGVTTGTVSGMMEETIIVSATINGTGITQTATVEVVAQAAATITQTLLTSGNNAANQKIYTTASIAPAPNALITVAVLMRRSSGAVTPTVTGGGMPAWDLVASADFDTQSSPTKRVMIFRALSATPGTGAITIQFASSVSNVQWIVSQWDGVETGGTNGSGAIVQTGTARSDGATSLAVSLAPFPSANDVAYGVAGVAKNGPIVTPASGFTEIAEVSSGETSALQAEWATNQSTVGASWATSTKAGLLAVEIKSGNTGPVVPVASVEVSPPSAIIAVGGTVQLSASPKDAGGEPLYGRVVTWASDAPGVADVSTTGLVTGKTAGGPVTITATSEGQSGTSSVTVTATAEPVASVEVAPSSASIVVGGTVQLTATPKDASGQPLTGRTITWASNATGVATVSTTGLVTGVAAGPATVTATSEGQSGSSSITVSTGGTAALVGQWSAVLPAPIVQVHQHLLLDGRVLSFGGSSGIPQVFDPATGLFTAVPISEIMFCSGHSWLPDGRLLVSGGGTGNGLGHPNSDIFDPATASWTPGPNMAYARWYPTVTTLPDGEVLTMAGADENGNPVPIPEVFNGTSWRQLTGASLTLPNYPRNFVAPDGRIFTAGPSAGSRWLDLTGAGSWTPGPTMNYGSRTYGSAVMYEAGKIMFVGGNSTPTNTAEIIDLNQPSPQWTYTGSLTYARWNLNATVLPTGDVLVTGGVNGDRSNPALKVNATELWNPATGTWTLLANSAPLLRGYHSTTVLLPDGRVIHSGGGAGGGTIDNLNYEIFSPPYLFKGARPSVTGVTGSAGYGQTVTVQTPDGASITKVTFIRFGSVTHAFDEGQRLVSLTFSQTSGGITVTLPSSRNIAPPGPYMLFLVNGNGVPSVGKIMVMQ